MDNPFKIEDSLVNKINYYHLMLLMASLPFYMFYSHLILISFALHTLIHLKKDAVRSLFNAHTLVLQSVFFITVLSTIYTINKSEAFNEWGKQIAILLFPVFICLNPLDLKKYQHKLFLMFAMVCTATVLYLYADSLITIEHYSLPFSTLFSSSFTNHNFSQPIDIHATFFSMQLAVALVFIIQLLIKGSLGSRSVFYLVCCAILTAGLIQLSSKSILIALFIAINVAVPWFILQGKSRWRFIAISASLSALVIVAILSSPAFRVHYISELKTDLSLNHKGVTLDSRLSRWKVSAGLISKKPIIGYGAGSEIGLLQDGFFKNKLYSSYLNKLNTHSEYLSLMIKSGIIGLLVYFSTLVYGFKNAVKHKDLLFFTFLMLIAIVSLSENVLDIDKGIFFYAFFFSFFWYAQQAEQSQVVAFAEPRAEAGQKSLRQAIKLKNNSYGFLVMVWILISCCWQPNNYWSRHNYMSWSDMDKPVKAANAK